MSCHGNQIWAIISKNCTDFSSVQDIEDCFVIRPIAGFAGLVNSNMLPIKFQGSQESYHGNQIWAIISQNCTDCSSVQEIEQFFARIVRFSGWSIQRW